MRSHSERAGLRENAKRDFSTAPTDTFAGAKAEEKASVCSGRNDKFVEMLTAGTWIKTEAGLNQGARRIVLRDFLFGFGGGRCAGEYFEHFLFCWGIKDIARGEVFGLGISGAADLFGGIG